MSTAIANGQGKTTSEAPASFGAPRKRRVVSEDFAANENGGKQPDDADPQALMGKTTSEAPASFSASRRRRVVSQDWAVNVSV